MATETFSLIERDMLRNGFCRDLYFMTIQAEFRTFSYQGKRIFIRGLLVTGAALAFSYGLVQDRLEQRLSI